MPKYGEEEAREAVASSRSFAEALRKLGMRPVGGNHRLFKEWVARWGFSTGHFDGGASARKVPSVKPTPLSEVLVRHSSYQRNNLKRRLFAEGIKERRCEMCGQDENWLGRTMSLILDHINGVPDDNRIENLRIVCPNCAATLDTHCGRKNRREPEIRKCRHCGRQFEAKYNTHRYCSQSCGHHWDRSRVRGRPKLQYRRATRPPYEQLLAEIEATSYCAVGRKYGVSDNAVRKWVKFYERERNERAAST